MGSWKDKSTLIILPLVAVVTMLLVIITELFYRQPIEIQNVTVVVTAPPPVKAISSQEPEESLPWEERLDLNTATLEQLDTLPGIGPVLAQRIVAYREENGDFLDLEELLFVDGIGEKLLAKIQGILKVGG